MGVRDIDRILQQWEMNARDLHRRMILAPTPRERERWHAVWLLAQGCTASAPAVVHNVIALDTPGWFPCSSGNEEDPFTSREGPESPVTLRGGA